MTPEDITLAELWRQGERLAAGVSRLDSQVDRYRIAAVRNESKVKELTTDLKEFRDEFRQKIVAIRADLKESRATRSAWWMAVVAAVSGGSAGSLIMLVSHR